MRYLLRKCGAILFTCAVSSLVYANTLSVDPGKVAQEKRAFIDQLVTQNHFNRQKLNDLFSTLHKNPKVIQSMTKPFEKEPWSFYRSFFITPERITLGAQYLQAHHHALQVVSAKYGVPASIIVAIIGVETEYGTHLGVYPVLNTLYTLGFYYPPRETFFRKELKQYLILARNNDLNIAGAKGSYAGALGIPQFMPSSYRYYGVAYKKGEPVNLFDNNDAIASVANYFHKNGWARNQPIARLLDSKYSNINPKTQTRLTLPLNHSKQYWAIYHNFNVIMTYNHNVVYAMAVYQLSKKIEKQYALNLEKEKGRVTASRREFNRS